MRFLIYLFTLLFLFLGGCQEKKSVSDTSEPKYASLDSLSKDKVNLKVLELYPQTSKDLNEYDEFRTLKSSIDSLSNANAFQVFKSVDSLEVHIANFEENIPENLKSNPISSRLVVLSTEIGMLRLQTEKKNPDPAKLKTSKVRLINAYNSLVIQLNELTLAIPSNIEEELLRSSENLRDSIIQQN